MTGPTCGGCLRGVPEGGRVVHCVARCLRRGMGHRRHLDMATDATRCTRYVEQPTLPGLGGGC